jgi:pyrroline-5-carboxylate reductase
MKIAFIGGGNMGEAMVAAILKKGVAKPEAIIVSDVADPRRRLLKRKYGVAVTGSNRQAVEIGDMLVLAIKPQNLSEVVKELKGQLKPSQLVLSIIAGVKTKTLARRLKHDSIVRAMPNTPAQVGEGMSVWTATAKVGRQQKEFSRAILEAMGKELYVNNEKYIDMATAISGSGPAYFFLMVEALVDAAVTIGLPRDKALALVLQTMLGSGHLIRVSGREPAELRQMVTSPGGTTAQALEQFKKGKFAPLVKQAVKAAYKKARQLGK